ncbi:NUDIX hydrolase [Flavobacterium cyanobacteriorum]|uniref:NUDIX hydrolase n=1 Tax=Flavobacterium cyanobacteriorum TaxID=2022802 RepID=A0A255ZQG5_9FLAO|nr:NUDIX hydrolase [Flavobacterium cyanobacteriorum]OYQ43807.1 NUDIX hydrolase [Flavobacterium cyanobacteriorum]
MKKTSAIFVTVDAVVFRQGAVATEILLIQRKNEPYKGKWALPGGFVDKDEDLKDAAIRELKEETGLHVTGLYQLGAFGKPHRDPRHHTVSVVYVGFAPENAKTTGADDALEAKWFPVMSLPKLAFDHQDIVDLAIQKAFL